MGDDSPPDREGRRSPPGNARELPTNMARAKTPMVPNGSEGEIDRQSTRRRGIHFFDSEPGRRRITPAATLRYLRA